MTTLNITFTNDENTDRFPIYCKYGGQHQAQPAYLFLDLRNGDCGADYNGEMGSTPVTHWHNIVLTFAIDSATTASNIESLIEARKEDFQAILDDSEIEWDGNNNVGKFGDKAKCILERLCFFEGKEWNPEAVQSFDSLTTMIDEEYFQEWVQDNLFPDSLTTPEEHAEELLTRDGDNDAYFSNGLNSSDSILSSLVSLWADRLYSGDDLPQHIAQYLVEQGTCDDSQWLEELNKFAKA